MRDAEDMKMVEDDLYEGVMEESSRIGALFLKVFGTEDGKEVLEFIKTGLCGLGMSVFSESAVEMARKAGKQEVGLAIEGILKASLEAEREKELMK